jgi:hypothetical protein
VSQLILKLTLKAVSSENSGGSKIVLIVGYLPGTMALDISLSFHKPTPYPEHISDSGHYSKIK